METDADPIRWGIVSTGNIARKMTAELRLLPDARLSAVSSRSSERAQAFADEYGVERAYGSVEDLLADDSVDIVYVANPHAQHAPIVGGALCLGRWQRVLLAEFDGPQMREVMVMLTSLRR